MPEPQKALVQTRANTRVSSVMFEGIDLSARAASMEAKG